MPLEIFVKEYLHRQDTCVANTPPSSGPMIDASPYEAPRTPMRAAAYLGFEDTATMMYDPLTTPAAPKPAIARPTRRLS